MLVDLWKCYSNKHRTEEDNSNKKVDLRKGKHIKILLRILR